MDERGGAPCSLGWASRHAEVRAFAFAMRSRPHIPFPIVTL